MSFYGYERAGGLIGSRNHVLLLSVMDNVNPAVRAASQIVPGVVPVTPEFGRGHVGEDKELRRRTLAGLCTSPNVYGVVLVSLEPKEAEPLSQAAVQAGKDVETVVMGDCNGVLDAIYRIAFAASRMRIAASALPRSETSLAGVCIGMECGGSDGTSGIVSNPLLGLVADRVIDAGGTVIFTETTEVVGAEDLVAERATSPAVATAIREAVQTVEAFGLAGGPGFFGANPVPDNVVGGLTTIEEKAIGAIAKSGSRPINGFLHSGERYTEPGLYYMDSTPPAMESMAALVAAGCNVILFSTGQGNPSGSPLAPTLKISANAGTVNRLRDAIDVDICDVLDGKASMDAGAERVIEAMLAVMNGKLTWSEATGFTDVSISRLGPSL